jgi:hypothetical protein
MDVVERVAQASFAQADEFAQRRDSDGLTRLRAQIGFGALDDRTPGPHDTLKTMPGGGH